MGTRALVESLEQRWLLSGVPRQVENLDRGIVAIRSATNSVFVSWRLLGDDAPNVGFNLYRNGGGNNVKLNSQPLTAGTNFTDSTANLTVSNTYSVRTVIFGLEQPAGGGSYTLAANTPVQDFLNVPLQIPPGGSVPDIANPGQTIAFTYTANDATVADVDGDGKYEIILKWDTTLAKDSSQDGFTGNTFLDCYKLDGTLMWRIDEGRNIRAGAHYTQFIAYDLDGDGKAEIALKTAPGTIDGAGNPVLMGSDTVNDDYRSATTGRINSGPEYLTIFNGQTGGQLATVAYKPDRIATGSWGDSYGNRQDRYLMCVAYLDGQRPSLVIGRGLFPGQSGGNAVRNELTAWDWRNGQVSMRWWFRADQNTGAYGLPNVNTTYIGQGNYEMHPADVDGDGRDEIVYGSMTVNDNGQPLYSTGLGHGDALHVSDMIPSHPGLEIYMPMESPGGNGHVTANVHDAATGAVLWSTHTRAGDADPDVGRGNAFDIDPRYPGYEAWDTYNTDIYNVSTGATIVAKPSNMFVNFGVWWDADPLRELEDGTTISDWNYTTGGRSNYDLDPATGGTQGFAPNAASNNGTKSTPCLLGDILGDWREEVIWRRSDNTALEIFTTPIATSTRYYTLMHDVQYREAIAWQNVGYNQPPHPGFFLGAIDSSGTPSPNPTPNVYYPAAGGVPANSYQAEAATFGGGAVSQTTNAGYNSTGYVNFPASGGFLRFDDVDGGDGGVRILSIRYASNTTRTGTMLINGVTYSITFPATLGFTDWLVMGVNVPLNYGPGTNQIRFESTGQGLPNIDEISISTGVSTGAIAGKVYHDVNDDHVFSSEPTLNGVAVYLDMNNDNVLNGNDPTINTSGSGDYSFTGLPDGAYVIRAIAPSGYVTTGAVGGTVSSAVTTTGVNAAVERSTYDGTSGVDNYRLRKNINGKYEILIGGALSYTVFAAMPSLTFNLSGGDDLFTLDAINGTPILPAGITLDGGANTDTIAVLGLSAATDSAAFSSSLITLNTGSTSYSGIEALSFDGRGGSDWVNASAAIPLTLAANQSFQSLIIQSTGQAVIPAANGTTSTGTLTIAAGGKLDLNDNDLVVNNSDFTTMQDLVFTGYSATPDGTKTGIISTSGQTAGTTILALFDNSTIGITDWNGHTVSANAIVGKYTYFGDADFNGMVTGDDYLILDANLNTAPAPGAAWLAGDMNFDGTITGDDYLILDANLNLGVGNPLALHQDDILG